MNIFYIKNSKFFFDFCNMFPFDLIYYHKIYNKKNLFLKGLDSSLETRKNIM